MARPGPDFPPLRPRYGVGRSRRLPPFGLRELGVGVALVGAAALAVIAVWAVVRETRETGRVATVTVPQTVTAVTTRPETVVRETTRTVAVAPRAGAVFALPSTLKAGRRGQLAWVALKGGRTSEEIEISRRGRVLATLKTGVSPVRAGDVYQFPWRPRRAHAGRLRFCVRSHSGRRTSAWSCAPLVVQR